MKTVTVRLSSRDYEKLVGKAATASGGLQGLIRRLQQGIRMRADGAYLTISEDDIARIPAYWRNTGGKPGSGGYQRRIPVWSLRNYLQSAAPLFSEWRASAEPQSYCYFKREATVGPPDKIKIGRGNDRRARTGRSTDNPRVLLVLLRIIEQRDWDEAYFHWRFRRLRIRDDQEWFWPGDELMSFIFAETERQRELAAKQELAEQRRRDDAEALGGPSVQQASHLERKLI